ncbi:MAG: formylglycine-generating enzyme family protein, partial [Myxococcales bacterium]|nr:formylglycine-generating enzyme family protein [Myxococcales bacterium]
QALQRAAFEQYDSAKIEEGEASWSRALELAAKADKHFREATSSLENAMSLDPSRADVRALLADGLMDRSYLAERVFNRERVEELIERLGVYDDSGERLTRWTAPGVVNVVTTPASANIWIERFEENEARQLVASPKREVGVSPFQGLELAQGSYRLSFQRDGAYPVVLPIHVERGETLDVAISLPRARDVPKGYVYVPAGRFLYGASDETMRTAFYTAVPLHPVSTGAYLIARDETTFGEWIEFLETLPPEERAPLIPKVDGVVYHALIEGAAGGWTFEYKRGGETYRAAQGEEVVYHAREANQRHDWLKMPVAGVVFDSALRYTRWLDASGKIPGARLCTEYEWERAARGADDRTLPHGYEAAVSDANLAETYAHDNTRAGPDEVGKHPVSRSPYGVDDMLGNVAEWTTSVQAEGEVMVRGAGFFFDLVNGRTPNRPIVPPGFLDPQLGFRVCATYPLAAHPPQSSAAEPGEGAAAVTTGADAS